MPNQKPPGERQPTRPDPPGGERPRTVAVIDDDRSSLEALVSLIHAAGHAVEGFESATRFLAEVSADAYAMLIVDVHMPRMGGIELLQTLRGVRDVTPVVLVTARADPGSRARALNAGAIGFLDKPVDQAFLLSLIDDACQPGPSSTKV